MASKTREPWGLRWRSSVWFVTAGALLSLPPDKMLIPPQWLASVGVLFEFPTFLSKHVSTGITTDLLVYSSIIPVIPFQLQHLHYNHVAALTGWLLCAYVRILLCVPPHL